MVLFHPYQLVYVLLKWGLDVLLDYSQDVCCIRIHTVSVPQLYSPELELIKVGPFFTHRCCHNTAGCFSYWSNLPAVMGVAVSSAVSYRLHDIWARQSVNLCYCVRNWETDANMFVVADIVDDVVNGEGGENRLMVAMRQMVRRPFVLLLRGQWRVIEWWFACRWCWSDTGASTSPQNHATLTVVVIELVIIVDVGVDFVGGGGRRGRLSIVGGRYDRRDSVDNTTALDCIIVFWCWWIHVVPCLIN